METFNIDKIEEILPRYCSGEATIEECRMVEEWIGQSEDNYRIVKQMYAIDQAMGSADGTAGEYREGFGLRQP